MGLISLASFDVSYGLIPIYTYLSPSFAKSKAQGEIGLIK